jgi:hypothetical protein
LLSDSINVTRLIELFTDNINIYNLGEDIINGYIKTIEKMEKKMEKKEE